jgi:hypothetical protein
MKVSHILCAMLACAPLTLEARATASSENGSSSVAAANVGEAAGRAAPSRNAGTKRGRTGDRGPNQAAARTSDGSKGRDAAAAASPRGGSVPPQAGAGKAAASQAGRSNADRLRSMLNARVNGHLARRPSRPVGSTRGAPGGPDLHGARGASPAGQPKMAASNGAAAPAAVPAGQSKLAASNSAAAMPLGQLKVAASNSAASSAARLSSAPRNSAMGGPHAQGLGRVGGPAISRATHSATVDGAQLHHKF